jgi:hypothetical protein
LALRAKGDVTVALLTGLLTVTLARAGAAQDSARKRWQRDDFMLDA